MSQSCIHGALRSDSKLVPERALGVSGAWCNGEGPGGRWSWGVLCHRAQTCAFPLSENVG